MNFFNNNFRGVIVVVRENESLESLIKRFKKKVDKNEILKDLKKHMFFKSPSKAKKRKQKEAESRKRKEEKIKLKGRNKNEKDSSNK